MKAQARASLDRDLHAVEESALRLGEMLDAAIEASVVALQEQDLGLARRVASEDVRLNAPRFEIEEACLGLIATRQPTAGDLRAVIATMSIVADLKRMGDHAAGIARTVLRIGREAQLLPPVKIHRMAKCCRSMLQESLEAFVGRDAARARSIAAQDDEIDGLYTGLFREVLAGDDRRPGADRAGPPSPVRRAQPGTHRGSGDQHRRANGVRGGGRDAGAQPRALRSLRCGVRRRRVAPPTRVVGGIDDSRPDSVSLHG